MTPDDLEGLVKRLTDAALRWDNGGCVEWPPELEPSTLMHQAAEDFSRLRAELDEARDDRDDFRERLHDLVMIDAEEWAIGGGPGFKERKEQAWNRAREPFEP